MCVCPVICWNNCGHEQRDNRPINEDELYTRRRRPQRRRRERRLHGPSMSGDQRLNDRSIVVSGCPQNGFVLSAGVTRSITTNGGRLLPQNFNWGCCRVFLSIGNFRKSSVVIFQHYFEYFEWWGAGVVICLERGADLHMIRPS